MAQASNQSTVNKIEMRLRGKGRGSICAFVSSGRCPGLRKPLGFQPAFACQSSIPSSV